MPDDPSPYLDEDASVLAEACEDGDRPISRGTARAAFRHRTFRRVFLGLFLSNIGSWMQNVVLGAWAFHLTGSAAFVGIVGLAQLGPTLLFALVGGVLADRFDRRKLAIGTSLVQAGLAFLLAAVARADNPDHLLIVGIVFGIGVANALFAPAFNALVASLVPREDLPGAVSLNSAQMNASRVIGPAIGGVLYARFGAPWVFALNASTYFFVIAAFAGVALPRPTRRPTGNALRAMFGGFPVVARDRVLRRAIVSMTVFSLFSLMFITQFPTLAENNLGMDVPSEPYGILYGCFGFGALLGALSIGTFLAGQSLASLVRAGFVGFAVLLAAFALLRDPAPAFLVALALGFVYFAVVTSLSTVVQTRLDDAVRGRVMAIWMMSFGGSVPVGGLLAGFAIDRSNVTSVVLVGAAVAVALAWYTDLREPSPIGHDESASMASRPSVPVSRSARAGAPRAVRARRPGSPSRGPRRRRRAGRVS